MKQNKSQLAAELCDLEQQLDVTFDAAALHDAAKKEYDEVVIEISDKYSVARKAAEAVYQAKEAEIAETKARLFQQAEEYYASRSAEIAALDQRFAAVLVQIEAKKAQLQAVIDEEQAENARIEQAARLEAYWRAREVAASKAKESASKVVARPKIKF